MTSHVKRFPVFIFLVLAVYASKSFWYDFKGIYDFVLGQVGGIRTWMTGYGIVLLAPIAWLFVKGLLSRPIPFFIAWIIIYTVINILQGFIYGNSVVLVFQDSFKYLLIPTGYFISQFVGSRAAFDHLLMRLAQTILAFMVGRYLVFAYFYDRLTGFVYGTIVEVFAIYQFLIAWAKSHRNRSNIALGSGSLLLCIFLVISGQKITLVVAILFGILYSFVKSPKLRVMVVIALPILMATLILTELQSQVRRQATVLDEVSLERLESFDIEHKVGESSARAEEITAVYREWRDLPASKMLFGAGAGAEFKRAEPHRDGSTTAHSVHFTPAAHLLRGGLVGVAYYLSIAWVAFGAFRVLARTRTFSFAALGLYTLFTLPASLVLYGLVDDLFVGVAYGLAYRVQRGFERSD